MGFFNLSTPIKNCFFSILANFLGLVEVGGMGTWEFGNRLNRSCSGFHYSMASFTNL
jgi:hypothetical protein